ncbi:MAG TPA: hypothetical protein P5556_08910 [Candidatus Gastranaerophilales bacterium]|nr:hypothetical protein [Candidatus Gastranaerophilales bacterium]
MKIQSARKLRNTNSPSFKSVARVNKVLNNGFQQSVHNISPTHDKLLAVLSEDILEQASSDNLVDSKVVEPLLKKIAKLTENIINILSGKKYCCNYSLNAESNRFSVFPANQIKGDSVDIFF